MSRFNVMPHAYPEHPTGLMDEAALHRTHLNVKAWLPDETSRLNDIKTTDHPIQIDTDMLSKDITFFVSDTITFTIDIGDLLAAIGTSIRAEP